MGLCYLFSGDLLAGLGQVGLGAAHGVFMACDDRFALGQFALPLFGLGDFLGQALAQGLGLTRGRFQLAGQLMIFL